MSDDEGNEAGSIAVHSKGEEETIPVMRERL